MVREGYEVRHGVVHDGAEVTLADALTGVRTAVAVSTRIDDALVALVRRYPRTAARELGQSRTPPSIGNPRAPVPELGLERHSVGPRVRLP